MSAAARLGASRQVSFLRSAQSSSSKNTPLRWRAICAKFTFWVRRLCVTCRAGSAAPRDMGSGLHEVHREALARVGEFHVAPPATGNVSFDAYIGTRATAQAAGNHLVRRKMRDRPPARSTAAAQPKMAQKPSALSACSVPVNERPATT